MKIRYLSSAEKYASALVPPNVSWRTLCKCFSEGRPRAAGDFSPSPTVCVWPAKNADPVSSKTKNIGRAKRDLGMADLDLLSLFEFHRCNDGLAVSQHLHFDDVDHFAAAQRIGEIIQILDRHGAELKEDVA